jgi:transcriptional regulator with XRE-family HTH domain
MSESKRWPPSGFAGRLKQLREQGGLTQAQLAEQAGCHPMTLAKLERGVHEPAWPLVLALAKALDIEVGDFVVEGGAAAEQRPAQMGRPRKAPVAAQDTEERGKATPATSGEKKSAVGQGRKRKGKAK